MLLLAAVVPVLLTVCVQPTLLRQIGTSQQQQQQQTPRGGAARNDTELVHSLWSEIVRLRILSPGMNWGMNVTRWLSQGRSPAAVAAVCYLSAEPFSKLHRMNNTNGLARLRNDFRPVDSTDTHTITRECYC